MLIVRVVFAVLVFECFVCGFCFALEVCYSFSCLFVTRCVCIYLNV